MLSSDSISIGTIVNVAGEFEPLIKPPGKSPDGSLIPGKWSITFQFREDNFTPAHQQKFVEFMRHATKTSLQWVTEGYRYFGDGYLVNIHRPTKLTVSMEFYGTGPLKRIKTDGPSS